MTLRVSTATETVYCICYSVSSLATAGLSCSIIHPCDKQTDGIWIAYAVARQIENENVKPATHEQGARPGREAQTSGQNVRL